MKEVPQLEVAEEVRIGMSELFVLFVRRLLFVERPVAWVLSFEGGRDDQDVVQTSLGVPGQDDARDPRIDGQPRQLAA